MPISPNKSNTVSEIQTGTVFLPLFIIIRAEHIPYRLKITVSVNIVSLEIAHLSTLVPAVYRDQRSGKIMCVNIFLCKLKSLSEIRWSVVLHYRTYKFVESWIVAPSNCHVREVRNAGFRGDSVTLRFYVREQFEIITVAVDKMYELIV